MGDKNGFNMWKSRWNGFYLAENLKSVNAYLTDIQWFGRALTQQEVVDITTCKSFSKGIIYSENQELLKESDYLRRYLLIRSNGLGSLRQGTSKKRNNKSSVSSR